MLEVQPAAPKVFYSAVANLILHPNTGQQVLQHGQLARVGEKIIEFMSQGDGYGRYIATDPEEIAFLERRTEVERDVFSPVEYNRRTTPADVQLAMLKQEHERLVVDHNRLVQQLQGEGKGPSRATK